MNPKCLEIAPLLRGLSFDGEKGDIVVCRDHVEDPDLACAADELGARFEKGMRSVAVEGVGAFLLGEDYDDAVSGKSNAPRRTGRAAVVSNKVCVVTGGAQGFGEEFVQYDVPTVTKPTLISGAVTLVARDFSPVASYSTTVEP